MSIGKPTPRKPNPRKIDVSKKVSPVVMNASLAAEPPFGFL